MSGNKPRKVVDLGFCPRCKEDLTNMMTRTVRNTRFCFLCSFDLEENKIELGQWVQWAKEYKRNMQ